VEHIAIDLGGRESQICVRSEQGTVIDEERVSTSALKRWLKARSPGRVIIETCAEAFGVADAAIAAGHEVRVVPAMLVRSLGVGQRGIKTDRRDAQMLSEVSTRIDLPSVHIPSEVSRERKMVCSMREGLVECRTKLINAARAWLRGQTVRVRSGAVETFARRVREDFARRSVELPRFVQRQLLAIDQLTAQVLEADKELEQIASGDPVMRRLMTAPGVGPVTVTRFVAALDDVGRFADAHRLESYTGLTPGENSSSDHVRRTGITKAGPAKLRWALVQAAWVMRRWRPHDPMVLWNLEVEKRRGKRVAAVALARKLAGVLYAMWRDGTTYNAHRAADTPLLRQAAVG
jgi:transposase